jgi:hypothetical protein
MLQLCIHSLHTSSSSDKIHSELRQRKAFMAGLWGQLSLIENGTLRGEGEHGANVRCLKVPDTSFHRLSVKYRLFFC